MRHNAALVPPEDRFVSRFAAEPPQDLLPYGRWAERLTEEFLAACLSVDTEGNELGDPGEVAFYPDRTWNGRTYVPATVDTAGGYQLYGFVSYLPAEEDGEPEDFVAVADFTDETAARNPDWKLDLCDDVVGRWRGEEGKEASTQTWPSAQSRRLSSGMECRSEARLACAGQWRQFCLRWWSCQSPASLPAPMVSCGCGEKRQTHGAG